MFLVLRVRRPRDLESGREELQYVLESSAGRRSLVVRVVLCQYRVRRLLVPPWIAGRRVDLDTHELVAQSLPEADEALGRRFGVTAEAQSHDAEIVSGTALHDREVGVGHAGRTTMFEVGGKRQ